MSNLAVLDKNLSMSHFEIAKLVGSRSNNVKRTIERLIESGVIRDTPMEHFEIINNLGLPATKEAYVFSGEQGRLDSIIVVAQLSPEFTARLVQRWDELEKQVAKPQFQIPETLGDALQLAANLAKDNEVLQLENKAQADEIADLEFKKSSLEQFLVTGVTPRDFCKQLNGVNANQVNNFLWDKKQWLYKGNFKKWRVSGTVRDKYLTERAKNFVDVYGRPQVQYTPQLLVAGAERLWDMYCNDELPMKAGWDGIYSSDMF